MTIVEEGDESEDNLFIIFEVIRFVWISFEEGDESEEDELKKSI